MKIRLTVCVYSILLNMANIDYAYSHSHINSLVNIKPNPTTKSKPSNIKFTSVSFITNDYRPRFTYTSKEAEQCLDEGYNVTSCPGLLPGDICPYEPNYMNGCCDLEYKHSDKSSCIAPLSIDNEPCGGKYRCYCDKTKYPYGDGKVCESPTIFNDESCEYGEKTYYSGCTCPSEYDEECLAIDNLVGYGDSCTVNGKTYYKNCACKNSYNLSCEITGPQNSGNYCLLNGVKYFNACKTYEENEEINFEYTGDVQSLSLPAGKYKLQTWGAQGGGTSGSKGGYAEGIISFDNTTTFYLFVGGKGAQKKGGWNGGGGSTGSTSYSSSGTTGYSYPYGGGGGTDIALVNSSVSYSGNRTTRDSASLLSRIIVAGGGAGYSSWSKTTTSSTTSWDDLGTVTCNAGSGDNGIGTGSWYQFCNTLFSGSGTYKVTVVSSENLSYLMYEIKTRNDWSAIKRSGVSGFSVNYTTYPTSDYYHYITAISPDGANRAPEATIRYYKQVSSSSTSSTSGNGSNSQQGGGTSGKGQYPGTQTSAGSGSYAGAFGLGATQSASNYRYASGGGGGGWYGGGAAYSDSSTSYVNYSGGGSGFVYTSTATVPSGYSVPTTYQLTNAVTTAGNSSFPSTSGGTETGHSGNGYIKITALEQYKSSEIAKTCDTAQYILDGVDANIGSYMTCSDANGEHYYYTSCNSGWTHSNGKCEINNCNGFFSNTDIEYCTTQESCLQGASEIYKCSQCKTDHYYEESTGQCLCSEYPYLEEAPDASKGTIKTCTDIEGTKYGYSICNLEMNLIESNGDCISIDELDY